MNKGRLGRVKGRHDKMPPRNQTPRERASGLNINFTSPDATASPGMKSSGYTSFRYHLNDLHSKFFLCERFGLMGACVTNGVKMVGWCKTGEGWNENVHD